MSDKQEPSRTRATRGTEPHYSKPFRRDLRSAQTKPEQLVWAMMRGRRLRKTKFRRQHTIGPYIVDFLCLEHKLVIELDGNYHDYIVEEDLQRQAYLEQLGYRVLRYWNDDVLQDAEVIALAISNALKDSAPSP